MLSIVGLGLDEGEITQKGLKALKKADYGYAEFYTNTKTIDLDELEEETGTDIEELSRKEVEQEEVPIENAEDSDICFLVSGDPLTATTHFEIKHQAEERDIQVEVIHAPSILTSVAETGLNVYKFGRVVTLPEEGKPQSVVEKIEKNNSIGLHTLILLDIDYSAGRAAEKLIGMGENLEDREAVVLERANNSDQKITVGDLGEIADQFSGETPQCLILTGEKSFKEEEFLEAY